MDDFKINRMFDELKNICWKESAYEEVDWYYAEEGLYILRFDKNTDKERYLFVKAKTPSAAISIGVKHC